MNPFESGGLRQFDWRFLLPASVTDTATTAPASLWLSDTAAHLEPVAIRAGFNPVTGAGPAQSAVVLRRADDLDPLQKVIDRVSPDGVLCWQVDRRLPHTRFFTPAYATAALRRLGLRNARVYWTRGTHDRPITFVPIRPRGPLRWFLENGIARRSSRIGVDVASLIAGILTRLPLFPPTFVVIASRAEDARALLPAALSAASDQLTDAIFVMGGEGDWSRVAALPFRPDASDPEIVIKLPRIPVFNHRTLHEQAVLNQMVGTAAFVRDTIARPIGEVRLGPLIGSVEARLDGRPLHLSAVPPAECRRAVDLLYAATEWLIDLSRTPCPGTDSPRKPIGVFAPVLERYAATFATGPDEADLIADTITGAADLRRSAVPVSWEHHDFGPWNILISGREIRVIDWEMARPGFGLSDIIYFAIHWNWMVRGITEEAERREVLLNLLDPMAQHDEIAAAAHDAIARYVDVLNLDPRLVRITLIHMLAEQALDRVARLHASGDTEPESREGNRYVGYLEAIAISQATLFAAPQSQEPLVFS